MIPRHTIPVELLKDVDQEYFKQSILVPPKMDLPPFPDMDWKRDDTDYKGSVVFYVMPRNSGKTTSIIRRASEFRNPVIISNWKNNSEYIQEKLSHSPNCSPILIHRITGRGFVDMKGIKMEHVFIDNYEGFSLSQKAIIAIEVIIKRPSLVEIYTSEIPGFVDKIYVPFKDNRTSIYRVNLIADVFPQFGFRYVLEPIKVSPIDTIKTVQIK